MEKIELLAPAGDMEKLKTAYYFGADAAYIGGKAFSLRAYSSNFDDEELKSAVNLAKSLGKKLYVTVNIFARNYDIDTAAEYFKYLEKIGIDGAIVSDAGLVSVAKTAAPKLPLILSTQANTLNYAAARFWAEQGVKRLILARELSINEIKEIAEKVPDTEIEVFIHGAMCISYSGRCLLSDYRTGRSSNRGECVQACRWHYEIREKGSSGAFMEMEEDDRGAYILNSKDLCLIDRIDDLAKAGVKSFKIEGRMKSEYYVATVVNAYRRALDLFYKVGGDYKKDKTFSEELSNTAHREFTTAYFDGENDRTENYDDSQSKGNMKFIASVIEGNKGRDYALIEMRNRFRLGDILEVLSPSESFGKKIEVLKMTDEKDEITKDAKLVQQRIKLYTAVPLFAGDILRKRND